MDHFPTGVEFSGAMWLKKFQGMSAAEHRFFFAKDAICGLQYHQGSASESSCSFGLEGETVKRWTGGLGGVISFLF